MTKVPQPTEIVHLTHIKNLSSILAEGGILSYHEMVRRSIRYQNIAYDHIQSRRESTMVLGASGGCLHDYAPFHFGPKPPMLLTISNGNVPGHAEGQSPLVYLVSTAQAVADFGLPFAFTDGHATMAFTESFFDLDHLDRIDWKVIRGKWWNDTPGYPDRKRRSQAEFLVHKQLPISLVKGIAVKNAGTKEAVLEILRANHLDIPVKIKSNWYY